MIATSTRVSKLDLSESTTLPTANNPFLTHQVTIGEDGILRIAIAVKLYIQDEIFELVNKEVAKAVEPLKAKMTKLETINNDLHLPLHENSMGEDHSLEFLVYQRYKEKTPPI